MTLIGRVAAAMKEQPRELQSNTSPCYTAATSAELERGNITSLDSHPELSEWLARIFAKVDPAWQNHYQLFIAPGGFVGANAPPLDESQCLLSTAWPTSPS